MCLSHIFHRSVSGCSRKRSFYMRFYRSIVIRAAPDSKANKIIFSGVMRVPWWAWMIIGIIIVFMAVDWVVVMGADPRRWKGGKK